MKKYLFIGLMILTLAVSAVGCGNHEDETLSEMEAASAAVGIVTEAGTAETSVQETTEASSRAAETEESPGAETTKTPISEKEAKKFLIEEFGDTDEGSGDKNVFTYEEIVNVDGVNYYSYKWEAGDGTYLCNAFVKIDGTDIMTGIYADGKWELGSDFGYDDGYFDDVNDSSGPDGNSGDAGSDEGYDEEYYDDSDDVPYDDGFGDIDPDEEDPAEDDFAEAPAE